RRGGRTGDFRHPGESRDPEPRNGFACDSWIPAFAGMTMERRRVRRSLRPVAAELDAEEIALLPARPIVGIRQRARGGVDGADIACRRIPMERQVDLVRGLVIALVEEQLLRRRAFAARAGIDRDRGDARLDEAVMIRADEEHLLGT